MPAQDFTPDAPESVTIRMALGSGFRIAVPVVPTSSDPNAGVHAVYNYIQRRRDLLVPPAMVGTMPFSKFLDHAPTAT